MALTPDQVRLSLEYIHTMIVEQRDTAALQNLVILLEDLLPDLVASLRQPHRTDSQQRDASVVGQD